MSPSPAWIDGTLYPDVDPPERVDDPGAGVEFLARLGAAWDLGVSYRQNHHMESEG